jgi:hypothetical protein
VPVLNGSAPVQHDARVQLADGTTAYQQSVRLSENISQGLSYTVYAVAQDTNRPVPNRMTALCTTPDGQPLQCIPADPPCVKMLQVACECIGLERAQVTLQVGKTGAQPSSEPFHVHYIAMKATLSGDGASFGSPSFPVPNLEQIRQGSVNDTTPFAAVVAAGSLCIQGNELTTFSVPDASSSSALAPDTDYVICVAPPPVNHLTCSGETASDGTPVPECTRFSTYAATVPANCTVSGCSCSGDSDCSTQLSCEADEDVSVLVKYRVSPSSCGGQDSVTCHDFLDPADSSCCPAMQDSLLQALECCPALAEGELVFTGSDNTTLSDMPSCGNIDVLAYATRTHCQRCPASTLCPSGLDFAGREDLRQSFCQSSALQYAPDASGACAAASALPPEPAPDATACGSPQLFEDITCAEDVCAPSLCQVTVCEPRSGSNGACSAEPGAPDTVYAISNSPGTVCCMGLPYSVRTPPAYDVLEGLLQADQTTAGYACATFTQARQWQAIAIPGLDQSAIFMVGLPLCWSSAMVDASCFLLIHGHSNPVPVFDPLCL